MVVQFGLFLLIQQIGSAARSHVASAQRTSGAWAYAVGVLVAYALMWGYYVFFEAIWDGQTPGKRFLDIRVVQDGGYSVSFGASAVRNLVRLLDLQPGFLYAVGLVSMTVSKSGKRLGDIAAGTIVVHEQRALIAAAVRSAPEAVSAPAITSRLTEEEFALLGRFIGRRAQLDRSMQANFTLQLATRFQQHLPDRRARARRTAPSPFRDGE